jgi:TPR repeat protein
MIRALAFKLLRDVAHIAMLLHGGGLAVRLLEWLRQRGDLQAAVPLGKMLWYGLGVPQDMDRAYRVVAAAANGNRNAMALKTHWDESGLLRLSAEMRERVISEIMQELKRREPMLRVRATIWGIVWFVAAYAVLETVRYLGSP